MARRDRFKQLVWLRSLPGDPDDGTYTHPGVVAESLTSTIHKLITEHGLWIEYAHEGKHFTLRCYPRTSGGPTGGPRVCASYKGTSLTRVTTAAVRDYAQYMENPSAASLSPYESVRWVA